MADDKKTIINQNITSTNQSGGVTAHTVNIGKLPRGLDSDSQQTLLKVPKSNPIEIACPLGDSEANNLAEQIQKFMRQNGYNVLGINRVMFQSATPKGVVIEVGPTATGIIVGTN